MLSKDESRPTLLQRKETKIKITRITYGIECGKLARYVPDACLCISNV